MACETALCHLCASELITVLQTTMVLLACQWAKQHLKTFSDNGSRQAADKHGYRKRQCRLLAGVLDICHSAWCSCDLSSKTAVPSYQHWASVCWRISSGRCPRCRAQVGRWMMWFRCNGSGGTAVCHQRKHEEACHTSQHGPQDRA